MDFNFHGSLRPNCSDCSVRLIIELWFVFLRKLVFTCRVIVCVASGCHLRSLLRTLLLLFMNLATFVGWSRDH